MYILVSRKSSGVYAVSVKKSNKVVLIFIEKDDADRYIGLLEAGDFDDKLESVEVTEDIIRSNCEAFGYEYTVIDRDHLVVPVDL
jgi:hypothetical protein